MSLVRRTIRITAAVVASLVIAFVAWSFYYINSPAYAEARRAHEERNSFQELARCRTVDDLEAVTGWLGVVLQTQDGGWIAIRYRDWHKTGTGPWSSAVARDSAGGWYVSSRHFCGSLQSYRQDREKQKDNIEVQWLREHSESFRKLEAIESCSDVGAAAPLLIDLGFERAEPPAGAAATE
jgi:hypothetical protein